MYGTIPSERKIKAKIEIKRSNGVWEDLTDHLSNAEIELGDVSSVGTGNSGVDGRVRSLRFSLKGGKFSPRDKTSPWNFINNQYSPLLWPQREVRLSVGIDEKEHLGVGDGVRTSFEFKGVPYGIPILYESTSPRWSDLDMTWQNAGDLRWDSVTDQKVIKNGYSIFQNILVFDSPPPAGKVITAQAEHWVPLFHGLLGDNISADGSCDCRDLSKTLQDCYIEEKRTYGTEEGIPAEVVIQEILDDNNTGVTLHCPISPGFMVQTYEVDYQSVWDAIQQVASQFGWFLGYRLIGDEFKLILMEPPREKTLPDIVLGYEHDFYEHELEMNDADIRNVVVVTFRDEETGQREEITVTDQDSIDLFGRRAMQIEEADTSLISTREDARRFALAALSDLKDLPAVSKIDMPLLPEMDVFSTLQIYNPLVSSTNDLYATNSVRHILDFTGGRFRTEIITAGRVIGGHATWLRKETRPGAKRPVEGKEIIEGTIDNDRLADGVITSEKISTSTTVEGNLAYVASGTSENGERVYLPWPEHRKPFVVASANALKTFDKSKTGYDQEIQVFATDPIWDDSQWYFDTYGMLVIPAVKSGWIKLNFPGTGYPTTGSTVVSGDSATGTTSLSVSLEGSNLSSSRIKIRFEVSYKKTSDSEWIVEWPDISLTVLEYQYGGYSSTSVQKSGLDPDVYQVRVKVLSTPTYGIPGTEWQYEAAEVLYNGQITWMATS